LETVWGLSTNQK